MDSGSRPFGASAGMTALCLQEGRKAARTKSEHGAQARGTMWARVEKEKCVCRTEASG